MVPTLPFRTNCPTSADRFRQIFRDYWDRWCDLRLDDEIPLDQRAYVPETVQRMTALPSTATRQPSRNHWQIADGSGQDLDFYHHDPFRRLLEAAQVGLYTVGQHSYPIGLSRRYYDNWRDSPTPDLGTWRVQLCPRGCGARDLYWIYIDPHGRETPTSLSLERFQRPPALPRPPAAWKTCGCGHPHICTACGQPYFLEIHGVADGSCSYCYYAG